MSKIIDTVVSINKQQTIGLSMNPIETDFVYNFYQTDESILNDKIIKNKNDSEKEYRYIRIILPIQFKVNSDKINASTKLFLDEISKIDSLNIDSMSYFNKLNKVIPQRKNLIVDYNKKELKVIKDYYNIESNTVLNKMLFYKKISILDDESQGTNISEFSSNSEFPESGLQEILENYDNIIYSDLNKKKLEVNENANIFDKFKSISKQINEIDFLSFSKTNSIKCGLLVEKYKKNDDKYEFLTAKFYNDDIIANILDSAVQYGQTYRYVISEVYFYSYPDINNRFILNNYLVCDNSYFTNNIVCREEVPPPPPNNINFKYSKNRLKITWSDPNNQQKDIKGYQILRRRSLEESFTLLKQLEGHLSTDLYEPEEEYLESNIIRTPGVVPHEFIDESYDKSNVYIYAIRSIDAHGKFSNYSMQIGILYDAFENKIIYDEISQSGAKSRKPNEFIDSKSIFFKNKIDIIDNLPLFKEKSKFELYIAPDFCKINDNKDQSKISVLNNKYKLTICRVNDLKSHEKIFTISNFN